MDLLDKGAIAGKDVHRGRTVGAFPQQSRLVVGADRQARRAPARLQAETGGMHERAAVRREHPQGDVIVRIFPQYPRAAVGADRNGHHRGALDGRCHRPPGVDDRADVGRQQVRRQFHDPVVLPRPGEPGLVVVAVGSKRRRGIQAHRGRGTAPRAGAIRGVDEQHIAGGRSLPAVRVEIRFRIEHERTVRVLPGRRYRDEFRRRAEEMPVRGGHQVAEVVFGAPMGSIVGKLDVYLAVRLPDRLERHRIAAVGHTHDRGHARARPLVGDADVVGLGAPGLSAVGRRDMADDLAVAGSVLPLVREIAVEIAVGVDLQIRLPDAVSGPADTGA